jgi:ubiquinone/menaquinone biosynthesis C-methylase UbiE
MDRREWILAQCKPNEKILNIGSGNGWIFKDSGLSVIHVDIDKYNIPYFIQMDAHDLKFPDKSFDVAVLGELLEHVRDPVQVLKEAKRVAKKLVITTPNEAEWISLYRPYQPIEERLAETGLTKRQLVIRDNPGIIEPYEGDNLNHCYHRRHYDETMLRDHLEQAGIKGYDLKILSYEGWSFFTVVAEVG